MSSLESRLKELAATAPVDVSSFIRSPSEAARGGGTNPGAQHERKVSLG